MLAVGTSGASIVALTFLPKCPLCVAMWLSAIGISSLFSKLALAAFCGVSVAVLFVQYRFRARKHRGNASNHGPVSGGGNGSHDCCS